MLSKIGRGNAFSISFLYYVMSVRLKTDYVKFICSFYGGSSIFLLTYKMRLI